MHNTDNLELFDHVNNGVLVLNADATVSYWNRWLEHNTDIPAQAVIGKRLDEIFPDINSKKLERKMHQAIALNSPSYFKGKNDKFLIPIVQKTLTDQHYRYMQQDVTINYLSDKRYFLISIYDCTAYLEMEQKLVESGNKIKKLAEINEQHSKSKSEFLAHTSHELRTPLNSILGFMELMKTTKMTREQRDYLHVMQDSSHSMLDLVNSVMSISEVEKGILEYKPTGCNIMDTVKSSAELFYAKALEKSISLVCFIDPAIPAVIYADGSKIRQMLLNFISNAIKFTQEGGYIWVRADMVDKDIHNASIRLSVTDNGLGMSEDFIQKIFMPYERDKTEEYYEGSGVGLYLCSKFAELMQTNIEVKSAMGEGSEFSFVIKSKVLQGNSFSDDVNVGDLHIGLILNNNGDFITSTVQHYIDSMHIDCVNYEGVNAAVKAASDGGRYPDVLLVTECNSACKERETIKNLPVKSVICMSNRFCDTSKDNTLHEKIITYRGILDPKSFLLVIQDAYKVCDAKAGQGQKRVLVMEDNYNNQVLMKVIFSKLGAVVDVASNGEAGLIYFKQNKYDLILIDINMPIKNGLETIQAIREYVNKFPCELPKIYALTAHALKEKQEEYLDYGFDGYLVKPINISRLKQVLNEDISEDEENAFLEKSENIIDYIRRSMHENVELDWCDVEKLMHIFFKSIYNELDEIQFDIKNGKYGDIVGKAHYIKGQFLAFHLYDLAAAFAELEKMKYPDEEKQAIAITENVLERVNYIQTCFDDYIENN